MSSLYDWSFSVTFHGQSSHDTRLQAQTELDDMSFDDALAGLNEGTVTIDPYEFEKTIDGAYDEQGDYVDAEDLETGEDNDDEYAS